MHRNIFEILPLLVSVTNQHAIRVGLLGWAMPDPNARPTKLHPEFLAGNPSTVDGKMVVAFEIIAHEK